MGEEVFIFMGAEVLILMGAEVLKKKKKKKIVSDPAVGPKSSGPGA